MMKIMAAVVGLSGCAAPVKPMVPALPVWPHCEERLWGT